jgi:hypothetical protein
MQLFSFYLIELHIWIYFGLQEEDAESFSPVPVIQRLDLGAFAHKN